ncbi:MAG: MurR/RpiR family transcriptional regulator [Kiloniellaceae bacterium]
MATAARPPPPPQSYLDLRAAISIQHPKLSKRLKQIAEFALANPNDMALETVAQIAQRAQVQPSSLVRFAKALGYDGFSNMQRVFRGRLVDRHPSYAERIKALKNRGNDKSMTPVALLDSFAEAAIHALHHLREGTRPDLLAQAIDLLVQARTVHVVGQRRSFPVAAYLAYALSQLERQVTLIDSVGGMALEQARAISKDDALIAVSFRTYSPDTLGVVQLAREYRASIVAITDGPLSPLAALSDVCLEVEEAQVQAFRALSATMCLALALVVSLGHRLGEAAGPEGASGADDL